MQTCTNKASNLQNVSIHILLLRSSTEAQLMGGPGGKVCLMGGLLGSPAMASCSESAKVASAPTLNRRRGSPFQCHIGPMDVGSYIANELVVL